jgi:hypothetical protein
VGGLRREAAFSALFLGLEIWGPISIAIFLLYGQNDIKKAKSR